MDTFEMGQFAELRLKAEFIQQLKETPAEALQAVGVEATEEILQALHQVDIDALLVLMEASLKQGPVPCGWP